MTMATSPSPDLPANLMPRQGTITVPAVIADLGDSAATRFLEFFTANIRNPNSRAAYAQAVHQFLGWCGQHHIVFTAVHVSSVLA
jgi:hypothetical protein